MVALEDRRSRSRPRILKFNFEKGLEGNLRRGGFVKGQARLEKGLRILEGGFKPLVKPP